MQRVLVKIFMALNERFKTERERLGLTQPDIAALAQVGKTTVINWEKGSSSPTASQLEPLAGAGMDVLFLITGRYVGDSKPAPTLSPEEATLLDYFRDSPPAVRRAALGALLGAATGGGQVMQNTGSGSVQIGSIGGNYAAPAKPPSPRKRSK